MKIRFCLCCTSVALMTLLGGCESLHVASPPQSAGNNSPAAIIATYIDIAQATYGDSLQTARRLEQSVNALLAHPSPAALAQARADWRQARIPYLQSEVFRFGNHVVDEWQPRVNAWPMDAGLIDYVAASYGSRSDTNNFYTANVIANPLIDIGGVSVDAGSITPQLLAETLQNLDGVDTNVATGYHAIEFLLWGQDLHGTDAGAGERPWTDYDLLQCTHDNCGRRRDYLASATHLLVTDLEEMVQDWQRGGRAYEDLVAKSDDDGLATVVTGMGSLAYGELAGSGLRLALQLHDPSREQDDFSDNTLWAQYYEAMGIHNIWHGRYTRSNGSLVNGASLEMLLRSNAPGIHAEMNAKVETTDLAMTALVKQPLPYDMLIAPGNSSGELLINTAVSALMEETHSLEKVISALGLHNVSIQGSDYLPATR